MYLRAQNFMWSKVASFILRQRISLLVATGVLTAALGLLATRAEMSYKPGEVLPASEPVAIDYHLFQERFGEEANVVFMALESDDFMSCCASEWIRMEAQLRAIPSVQWTLSALSAQTIHRNDSLRAFETKPLFNPDIIHNQAELNRQLQLAPAYQDVLWDKNHRIFVLMAGLDPSIVNSKAREPLISDIERELAYFEKNTGTELHISGLPFIRTDSIRRSKKEILLFTLLAAVMTSLVLFLFFRSAIAIIIPLLVVATGIAWSSGLLVLFGFKITTLTGLIPPLMIVIGVPNAVYMITKFHQEFLLHGNKMRGLTRVIQKTGRSIFLTNATTAIGFGTLISTNSRLLVEFGLLASASVFSLFLLSIVLIPILFSLFPPPKHRHLHHLKRKGTSMLTAWLTFHVARRRKYIYLAISALTIFSILGAMRIVPSGKMSDDIPKNSRTFDDLRFFETHFGGVMPIEVMVDCGKPGGASKDLKFWRRIEAFQDSLQTLPALSRPMSMIELVKTGNQALYSNLPEAYVLPSSLDLSLLGRYLSGSQKETALPLTKSYMDSTKQIMRIQARMEDMGTYEMHAIKAKMMDMAQQVFGETGETVVLTGAGIVMLQATDYLVKNLVMSLLLAILLIALIMAVMFRSIKMALISILPNFIPLLFTAGIMGWFGIPLKASTSLIFSVAFGISVDDTIHFLSKYRQDLKLMKGYIRPAVHKALNDTALSMAYTSVILFFGFSIFIGSEFGGTVALGILVSMTLLVAMITNLTLLPSLLISLQKKEMDNQYASYNTLEEVEEERAPIPNDAPTTSGNHELNDH